MTDPRAEAERIKERIRKAQTPEMVRKVADQERKAVRALYAQSGTGRTYAIQISNLKVWRLEWLERENR